MRVPAARSLGGAAQRLIVPSFCWATAVYAFMSASPFAYRQFLAPRVFGWVGTFSDWHAWLYWGWFALAIPVRALRGDGLARKWSLGFVACGIVLGIALTVHPVLPRLVDDQWSIVVGLIALAPIFWLASIEVVASDCTFGHSSDDDRDDGRLLLAAIGTAIFVTVVHAVQTPLAVGSSFEPDLLTAGLAAGFAWNLIDHFLIFGAVFLVLAIVGHATRPLSPATRYGIVIALIALVFSWMTARTLCDALGLSGGASALIALAFGASMAVSWAASRFRDVPDRQSSASPFDRLFGSVSEHSSRVRQLIPLLVLAAVASSIGVISRIVDWDFLLLKSGLFAVWIAVFTQMYRLSPRVRVSGAAMSLAVLAPLALHASSSASEDSRLVPRHSLDRYAVYNPSFRVVDGLLRDSAAAGDDSFQRFLRANTGLGSGTRVSPINVDFAEPHATPRTTPNIFLFVVDSLRRDYLQPYNRAVTFTPNIARFAAESQVFQNVFTAYGATGLSVPAIWSGAIGVHKQYVTPFAPMNALAKLLDANGYRRYLTRDSVVRQILPPSAEAIELDAGVRSEDVAFCQTAAELQRKLDANADGSRPIFAYSLPQDLHISNIISASVPAGELYPGFHAPYATRVRRIDTCFGGFVDFLKRKGWYDRSLIVVTADHGEMLGEDGFWGHVYYLFPPVVQVPLIVHLPANPPVPASIDPGALALTIDITPTIYAALGYDVRRTSSLQGRSLIGTDRRQTRADHQHQEVLTASYSAVYASLAANGYRLYIVDAVQHREYAYARNVDGRWAAIPITAGIRESGRRAIRERVYAINSTYHVSGL